jgi:hypothetical protein
MFARCKRNKSGTVSAQVISKSEGSYRVVKTIDSSADSDEIFRFKQPALDYILTFKGQQPFSFDLIILLNKKFSLITSIESGCMHDDVRKNTPIRVFYWEQNPKKEQANQY